MQLKAQIALEKDNKSLLDGHTTLIQQNADAIVLKASSSSLSDLAGRVTTAEGTIVVQAGQIASKVASTDYNGVTIASLINQTAETIKIQAGHISLEGLTTVNSNFKVLLDGSIEAVNGKFSGNITATSGTIGRLSIVNDDIYYQSDLFAKQYDNSDLARFRQILASLITPTSYDFHVYDLNNSGTFSTTDLVMLRRIVDGVDPNPNKMIRSVITIGKTTGEIVVAAVSTQGYVGPSTIIQAGKIAGKMANIESASIGQLSLGGLEVYSDAGTLKVR